MKRTFLALAAVLVLTSAADARPRLFGKRCGFGQRLRQVVSLPLQVTGELVQATGHILTGNAAAVRGTCAGGQCK